jgi:hypothetical protein
VERFHGFNIVLHRGMFLILDEASVHLSIECLDDVALGIRKDIPVTDSLESARQWITQKAIVDLRFELNASGAREAVLKKQVGTLQRHVSEFQTTFESRLQTIAKQLEDHQVFVTRMRNSFFFTLRRKIAGLFGFH